MTAALPTTTSSGPKGQATRKLTLGTRGSKLALAQTEIVRAALLNLDPALDVRMETIATTGDVVQDRPLSQIGGNGLFVRQIEVALAEGRIDAAIHSAKDLPSQLAPGLLIAAYLPRADARDVLVSRDGLPLNGLPEGAKVGTSSPRRACQIAAVRPDLRLLDIRGNVDTRLRKLREGDYDAIVLAAAGLDRLGLLDQVSEWLDPGVMTPAVGQGALAIEVRAADDATVSLISRLNDPVTWAAVTAERAFLAAVGGSCALPIAAHATLDSDRLTLAGMIGSLLDGSAQMVTGRLVGKADDPQSIGTALAHGLAARRNSITDQASLVTLPLRGRRIVVTRAREQSEGLVEKLGALGAEVTVCPAIRIVPPDSWEEIDAAIGRLSSYDWVIFTSVNGVRVFFDRLQALGADTSQLCGRKLGAIGPATAEALEGAGCAAHFVPSSYVAEALVEQIGDVAGCSVLLPRADIAREALAEGLRAKGAHVDEVTAYRTVPGSAGEELANLLRAGTANAITFTSSSTVSYTVRGLVGAGLTQDEAVELLSEANPVCIGPITAATAAQHGLTIARTASEYTTGGLVDALLDLFGTGGGARRRSRCST